MKRIGTNREREIRTLESNAPRILPGAAIGVLGGGQLGRMMALAGRNMGYRFVTLDPTPNAPCGQAADQQITAPYDDMEAARKLAELSDVITYEFENVDADVTAMLMKESYVPQGSELLYTTQHRLREKRAVEAAGIAVTPYSPIHSVEKLEREAERLGWPCVLKTATGGYDGKGQRVLRDPSELAEAYAELAAEGTELVLEKFIPFTKEISVIAARSAGGGDRRFPAGGEYSSREYPACVDRARSYFPGNCRGGTAHGCADRRSPERGRTDRCRNVPHRGRQAVCE
ncbi:hypothetical protein PRECH8_18490 [Insulibacter thermoxylanivorax]|uniref:ATP-grasp domain-containing protein n=1 Tax=Insulibacter thermoxylanivorax TaxID=2749268 RepID=A0A916QGD6_9BACL|nr:hypothetical protein PRECH8_18490 [Insulibacter thermoxylanivorax]